MILTGHLDKDADVRYTRLGLPVAKLVLLSTRFYRGKTGEPEPLPPQRFTVFARGPLAERVRAVRLFVCQLLGRYLYLFTNPKHTGEIRYVFGNLTTDGQYDETDQVIADAMQSAWTAFARTGVPTVAREAAWPAVDIRSPQYMSIEDRFLLRPYAANELTRLINSMRNAGDSAPETGFWKSRS